MSLNSIPDLTRAPISLNCHRKPEKNYAYILPKLTPSTPLSDPIPVMLDHNYVFKEEETPNHCEHNYSLPLDKSNHQQTHHEHNYSFPSEKYSNNQTKVSKSAPNTNDHPCSKKKTTSKATLSKSRSRENNDLSDRPIHKCNTIYEELKGIAVCQSSVQTPMICYLKKIITNSSKVYS